MKTENWNGHEIRFVEVSGEWWAVGKDIADALGYSNTRDALAQHVDAEDKNTVAIYDGIPGNPNRTVISEIGIYALIFGSEMPEAKSFKRWVSSILKNLRQAAGLEGFQVFRMLDKEHQREAMKQLKEGLSGKRPAAQVDYIKANTITNKAISSRYGYPKMLKKSEMSPEMLVERQAILDDTVHLMEANEKYGLGLSVSEQIYGAYLGAAVS